MVTDDIKGNICFDSNIIQKRKIFATFPEGMLTEKLYEPRHEKTWLRGLQPGTKTQTGLLSYSD